MLHTTDRDRAAAQSAVREGLARLQTALPIEARLRNTPAPVRTAYAGVLRHFLGAATGTIPDLEPDSLSTLVELGAVVPEAGGFGCYPFTTNDTGIRVHLPVGGVYAMCAIDALAIARLAQAPSRIATTCVGCASPIAIRVEANGGLDHDQVHMARVLWREWPIAPVPGDQGPCRQIRFLCPRCPTPHDASVFSLPQAAAIGNVFFRFQSALLATASGTPLP